MTVPQRHANGRLLPGQASLNAGGRPRTDIAELRQKYRNRLPELLERLFDLTESDNPHVCIAATKELLDRLLGKPAVFVDTTHTKFDLGAGGRCMGEGPARGRGSRRCGALLRRHFAPRADALVEVLVEPVSQPTIRPKDGV